MKKLALTLAAVAALAFSLSVASACGDDAKASTGTKACCAAKGAKSAAAGGGDGKTDAKMSCAAHKGDKSSCPMGKDAKKTEVSMSGKVLCEHCDLHKKDSCNTVFQADGSKDYLQLCPDTDVAAVKKAGKDGKATLEIKGFMCENAKGEKMLQISTFTPKA